MFSWSISRTDAVLTATATERLRMIGARGSRWSAESVLESRTPGMRWQPGFMITAAATTAPEVGATPTSSTPTTRSSPSFQRRRSWRRVGTIGAIGHKPTGIEWPRHRSGADVRASSRRDRAGAPLRRSTLPALPERGGLADAVAQEVKLCATGDAVADDRDLLDARAVDLERTLDTDARRDPADRDGAGDPTAAQPHDGPLEHLDALAAALHDLGRHLDGVTRRDLGEIGS